MSRPTRLLFAYPFLSLGGVEVMLRSRLLELERRGVEARALFLEGFGGESLFAGWGERVAVATDEADARERIARFDPDWVISIDAPTLHPMVRAASRARLVYEVHSSYAESLAALRDPTTLEGVLGLLVPSPSQGSLVIGLLLRELPLRVVPNALPDLFRQPVDVSNPPPRPVVVWVGRLDPHKSWRAFVAFARELRPRGEIDLWLIGGGRSSPRERRTLEEVLARPDVGGHLHWFPSVEYERMPEVYAAVARSGGCLVSTSWAESFGLAVLEAMAMGCPVVVPAVAGLEDLVSHGDTGWLYAAGDIRALCEQVEVVLADGRLRRSIAQSALERARTFTPEVSIEALLSALSDFLALERGETVATVSAAVRPPDAAVRAMNLRLVEAAAAMAADVAERDQIITHVQSDRAALHERVGELAGRLAEVERLRESAVAEAARLGGEREALVGRIAELEQQRDTEHAEATRLTNELIAIHRSRWWRAAHFYWSLRRRLNLSPRAAAGRER